MNTTLSQDFTRLLETIAQKSLLIDTLETQNSDSLDFHEVAVWQLREALEKAFFAGLTVGQTLK